MIHHSRARLLLPAVSVTLLVWVGYAQQQPAQAPAAGRGNFANNFTGNISVLDASALRTSRIHFDAGARTNWHIHAEAQVVVAEKGRGRYQEKGGAVADFGTAITFDVVSEAGEYLGGVIGPGVEISMEALAQRTAKLPPIELGEPPSEAGGVIGRSTHQSLLSGITYGFAGAVDAIAGRIQRELGSDVRFVATGGHAAAIVPFCELIDEVDDLLTLTGLRLIWERNL